MRYAVPLEQGSQVQIQSEDQNWSTRINGSWPDYFAIRSWNTSLGHAYTMSDVEAEQQGPGPGTDGGGQAVRAGNGSRRSDGARPQRPIPGDRRRGKEGPIPDGPQDYDDAAFCPVSTFQSKIQGGLGQYVNGILYIGAVSESSTAKAQRDIAALLRERHHLQDGVDDDFDIRNLSEIASAREEGTRTLSFLLLSIALVSLIVGGIGIMNIMLVSVTERTEEIGLRMALGARPRDILTQFLMEALALAVAGGLLGVMIGLVVAQRMTQQFHTQLVLHPSIIAGSVAFKRTRRRRLRTLPGEQGISSRSHRSPEVRMTPSLLAIALQRSPRRRCTARGFQRARTC